MYPNAIIGDITLYEICIALGIIAALVIFRIMADKLKIGAKLFNFTLICGLCAIISGIFFAVFVQALYNISSRGAFIIDKNTGATFAGGLLGGAAVFFIIYFVFGKKADINFKSELWKIVDCGACAIPAAHSIGRIGCLMAGCCYGHKTESFIGIYMNNLGYKVVPTQLFEAIFLALLAITVIVITLKKGRYAMIIYLFSYGTWRFFIEFARDDYRGESLVPFLTPSQLISVLMVIGGAVLLIMTVKYRKRRADNEN